MKFFLSVIVVLAFGSSPGLQRENALLRRTNQELLQQLKALSKLEEAMEEAVSQTSVICEEFGTVSSNTMCSGTEHYLGGGFSYSECQDLCTEQALANGAGCCESRATSWGKCSYYVGASQIDGFADTKGAMCSVASEPSQDQVTQTSENVDGKRICLVDHGSWSNQFGDCPSYAPGNANNRYCSSDGVNGAFLYKNKYGETIYEGMRLTAAMVCPQCGECVSGIYGAFDTQCEAGKEILDEDECRNAVESLGLPITPGLVTFTKDFGCSHSGKAICYSGFVNVGPGYCRDNRNSMTDFYADSNSRRVSPFSCQVICATNAECIGYDFKDYCKLYYASGKPFASGTPNPFVDQSSYSGTTISRSSAESNPFRVGCMRKMLDYKCVGNISGFNERCEVLLSQEDCEREGRSSFSDGVCEWVVAEEEGERKPVGERRPVAVSQENYQCSTHSDCVQGDVCVGNFCVTGRLNVVSARKETRTQKDSTSLIFS